MLPLAGRVAVQPHDEHNIHHANQDGTREGAGPAARAKSMAASPMEHGESAARCKACSRPRTPPGPERDCESSPVSRSRP
jgi:hypothetical protein